MSQAEQVLASLLSGGEAALDDYVQRRESEAVYLDFKRAATTAAHTRLQDDDRKNLAKAISGFGNTSGGVVVWGIDCRNLPNAGDVAQAKFPVPNAPRFLSWLEGAVSGSSIPVHTGVQHRIIAQRPDLSGFVVSVSPPADNFPLQVPNTYLYYMRAGSNFSPIPHSILAGMFGRRPTPLFKIDVTQSQAAMVVQGALLTAIQVTITNIGAGVARDVFVTLEALSIPPGQGYAVGWMQDPQFTPPLNGPASKCALLRPDRKLPPGGHAITYSIELRLTRPIGAPLELRLTCGADNGPPTTLTLAQSANRLDHCCVLGAGMANNPNIDASWLGMRMFGLTED
jgi:hypothetical protein